MVAVVAVLAMTVVFIVLLRSVTAMTIAASIIGDDIERANMSSRTCEECVDLALNASASQEGREEAIQDLKRTNECDELAALTLNEELEDQYRRQALRSLATPQCDSMLRNLIEGDSLDSSYEEIATEHLQEIENT